jgi:GTP-binding protein
VYVLFKAKNGLNYYDEAMLAHLGTLCNRDTKEQQERGLKPFTIQPILTQLDNIPTKDIQQTVAQLRVQIADLAPNGLLPPILTCALNTPFGLDEVRKSILEACSVEEDQQE